MGVYHQIGHNSFNLVNENLLNKYLGMVCSPLNYAEVDVIDQINQINQINERYQSIFDPQMYYPKTQRGELHTWSYFPDDFDSANPTDIQYWKGICDKLINTCDRIRATHICSPCIVPNKFSSDYYRFNVNVGNYLYTLAQQKEKAFFQTTIVDYKSIKEDGEVETIASIISQTNGDSIYLIIRSDIEPRRELSDELSLKAIMKLIRLLKDSGMRVFVGFCSSEFILWKYAGAEMLSTGKFFNLRRFTSSRFEEPSSGGGQLPYWFEKKYFAFFREGDLIRLRNENMIDSNYVNNPFSIKIIYDLQERPGKPWVALSWRQYLYEFAEMEFDFTPEKIKKQLAYAEKCWEELEDKNILMEESRNNGSWIRKWRIAINSFDKEFK